MSAAMKASSVAARDLHDQAIGRGPYHLFRLPEQMERSLDGMLMGEGGVQLSGHLEPVLAKRDELMVMLESLAARARAPHVGAVKVGPATAMNDRDTWSKTAGLYLAAMKDHVKTFPYFEA